MNIKTKYSINDMIKIIPFETNGKIISIWYKKEIKYEVRYFIESKIEEQYFYESELE